MCMYNLNGNGNNRENGSSTAASVGKCREDRMLIDGKAKFQFTVVKLSRAQNRKHLGASLVAIVQRRCTYINKYSKSCFRVYAMYTRYENFFSTPQS